jgi:replicative DNA helicase
MIHTPYGKIPIKNLEGKKDFKVLSYNQKTKQQEVQIAERCIKVKKDYVYEVEMMDGIKIKATAEHKFITVNGWKMLKELQDGDDIIGI